MDRSVYSSTLVKIPTPKFVVFYNGVKKKPEEQILRLSDLYEVKVDEPDLELKVRMLNINPGYNDELMETCRTLDEYCQYVACVRMYTENMPIEEAVEKAVMECIKKNILSDFLKSQRAEVVAMSILEYDEEVELRKLRAAEYSNGKKEGEKLGEKQLLISQLCKKLKKHQTIPQIAEALEEPEEKIERLCKIAEKYAPEYDVETVCVEILCKDSE